MCYSSSKLMKMSCKILQFWALSRFHHDFDHGTLLNKVVQKTSASLSIIHVDSRFSTDIVNVEAAKFCGEKTAALSARYAALHSYDAYRVLHDDAYPAMFVKTSVVALMLDKDSTINSDWILLLDTDAFIAPNRFQDDLDTLLSELEVTDDIHMIIEQEPPRNWNLWTGMYESLCPKAGVKADSRANTGAYLVRNSQIGRQIFKEWRWYIDQRHHLKRNAVTKWTSDQMPFNCDVISHPEYSQHILVDTEQRLVRFKGYEFEGMTDTPWFYHYTKYNKEARAKLLESFLKETKPKGYVPTSKLVKCEGMHDDLICKDFQKKWCE